MSDFPIARVHRVDEAPLWVHWLAALPDRIERWPLPVALPAMCGLFVVVCVTWLVVTPYLWLRGK